MQLPAFYILPATFRLHPGTRMTLLLDGLFSSVALSHLIVDVLNGQRAVLLAYLSGPLGLSNTALGLISTLYMLMGSLSQPVFGYLGDRLGPRWLVSGGVIGMGIFFTLAVMTPGTLALVWLMLASLCSAAFHPSGTMQATLRGHAHFAGKETTSAAYFFFFGQAGFFFGPMIGGPILDRFGPMGLLLLSSLAVPVGMNAANQLRANFRPVLHNPNTDRTGVQEVFKGSIFSLAAFALLAAFQAWSQQNMITFLPKYLSDMGQSASTYGLMAAMFMGGSALGNALGGSLADRFGKRRVASLALALASIPLYLVGTVGWSAWLFVLVPLAGALTGATHSIIVVLAQRRIPSGMALASGLILGFMFSSGAVGTLFSGFLADAWGFPPVFHLTAGIALAAALLARTLQKA